MRRQAKIWEAKMAAYPYIVPDERIEPTVMSCRLRKIAHGGMDSTL